MNFKVGDWVILKETQIEICKERDLDYSKYAEMVVEFANDQIIYLSRNNKINFMHSPFFRMATKEEIKVGKLKSLFYQKEANGFELKIKIKKLKI
jgi:hypothetical protein